MNHAEAWEALIALDLGIPTWLNGVPVRRVPCAGHWFEVGTCVEHPDVRYQRLRLSDAALRVRSGHFPTLKDGPAPLRACVECKQLRRDRWDGAFTWCIECVECVCRDCHSTHRERHKADVRCAGCSLADLTGKRCQVHPKEAA